MLVGGADNWARLGRCLGAPTGRVGPICSGSAEPSLEEISSNDLPKLAPAPPWAVCDRPGRFGQLKGLIKRVDVSHDRCKRAHLLIISSAYGILPPTA